MSDPRDFKAELNDLDEKGLRRKIFDRAAHVINFSSNDYLGLSRHPTVIRAATAAIETYGAGGTSSRLLAGTTRLHRSLETALASFFQKEAALVFSSGYHANTGTLPALVGRGDAVFFDRLCHASIIDGVKLSGARFFAFDHNDPAHAEALLRKNRSHYRRALVVSEGIFSMDGDIGRLPELGEAAHRWEALFYVDEAHAIGMLGPSGRGAAAETGCLASVDVFVGTLSKALGSQGGFVAGRSDVIDWLVSRARSFAYTTALSPGSAGAAMAALNLVPALDSVRRKIFDASALLRTRLRSMGFDTLTSASQIVPVRTGGVEATRRLADHLLSRNYFVPSIRPPTVPVGEGRVRLSVCDGVAGDVNGLLAAFLAYTEQPKAGEKIVNVG